MEFKLYQGQTGESENNCRVKMLVMLIFNFLKSEMDLIGYRSRLDHCDNELYNIYFRSEGCTSMRQSNS